MRYDTFDKKGRWMGGYDSALDAQIKDHTARSMAFDKAALYGFKVVSTAKLEGVEFQKDEVDFTDRV